MNDITWITSCNSKMYETQIYGKCLDSWINIPGKKVLYAEDTFSHKLFETRNLNHDQIFGKGAKRFYNKALSIYNGLNSCDTKFLVWLDSDIEILKSLDFFPDVEKSIATMFYPFPENIRKDLPKSVKHDFGADTGIVIFNLDKLEKNFKEDYIDYWRNPNKLYDLYAPKDTWVLCDLIYQKFEYENLIVDYKEYPIGSNYFEFTKFKDYFFHYIGKHQK